MLCAPATSGPRRPPLYTFMPKEWMALNYQQYSMSEIQQFRSLTLLGVKMEKIKQLIDLTLLMEKPF